MSQSVNSSRVAIVTGSSRGIGAAVARRLARDGLAVVVNYVGSADEARALADRIAADGGRVIAARGDVSEPAEFAALFDRAEAAFGGVDVLVNNGGIMALSPIAQTDDESFDRQVAVNLKGVFNGLRLAARRLRDGGRIVNFSSSVVGLFQPGYGAYAATKAGVEAMTHVLSKELGSRGITVNAVAPGPVNTPLFTKDKPKEVIDRIVGMTPFGRLGEPDDIASTVSLLAGPDAGWITGQVVRANGGIL